MPMSALEQVALRGSHDRIPSLVALLARKSFHDRITEKLVAGGTWPADG